jgi:hypothetical protein
LFNANNVGGGNLSEMPPPDQQDIEWAYYLWNSLSVGDGRWVLPNVGAYVRTGVKELTLRELHFSRPTANEFGNSVFDQHHWIMALADNIGWEIKEAVLMATDNEGEINIPDDLVGLVSMCADRCGAVFRVEGLSPSQQYVKISENLVCPCCGNEQSVEPLLKSVHVVIDDRGYRINQDRMNLEKKNEEE